MMNNCYQEATRLPDILIIAGDTTPWVVTLVDERGTPYTNMSDCSVVLTLSPIASASSATPILKKTGNVGSNTKGATSAVFSFEAADTINLMGKFIYQITVSREDEHRVRQGFITIKKNNDI